MPITTERSDRTPRRALAAPARRASAASGSVSATESASAASDIDRPASSCTVPSCRSLAIRRRSRSEASIA